MKRFIVPTLKSSVMGFVFYSYLITLSKINFLEKTSSNWIVTATVLSILFGLFTTILIQSLSYLVRIVYKNKFSNHKSEVVLFLFVLGIASLYSQVEIGKALLGYQVDISPIEFTVYGFLLPFFATYFYSDDGLESVEVIILGSNLETSKDCVEHYETGATARNLEELQKILTEFKTKQFILIDLSEYDVEQVVKLLAWTPANISYLYTKEEPVFTDLNLFEWKKSHNFRIFAYYELTGSALYARGH